MILAVDFDGTIVEHEYPEIGKAVPGAAESLRMLSKLGVKIILWTMRHGDGLDKATDYCAHNRIPIWAVNSNPEQESWTNSPKAYAICYVDDAAAGCPMRPSRKAGNRPMVDWDLVMPIVMPRLGITLEMIKELGNA